MVGKVRVRTSTGTAGVGGDDTRRWDVEFVSNLGDIDLLEVKVTELRKTIARWS